MDLREISEFFRDLSIYVITFVVIALIFIFVVALQPIAGNSMVPTLQEGDVVLVSKFSYRFFDIKRNDIVTLSVNGKSYVKRVIGLPGEDIKFIKNILYIDDNPFTENFLPKNTATSGFTLEDVCKENECPDGKIPDGKYLVLGDNRPESEDSRTKTFGLVSNDQIKGKVFFKIWPFNRLGKVN